MLHWSRLSFSSLSVIQVTLSGMQLEVYEMDEQGTVVATTQCPLQVGGRGLKGHLSCDVT
jgi:hypothetical protein